MAYQSQCDCNGDKSPFSRTTCEIALLNVRFNENPNTAPKMLILAQPASAKVMRQVTSRRTESCSRSPVTKSDPRMVSPVLRMITAPIGLLSCLHCQSTPFIRSSGKS